MSAQLHTVAPPPPLAPASTSPTAGKAGAEVLPVRQAGFVSRAAALILDIMIVTAGSIIFTALISLIFNFFGISAEGYISDDTTRNIFLIVQFIIVLVAVALVVLFIPGYFVGFWAIVGATPGKQILGLRVQRTNGARMGYVRATFRFVGYFISAIFFFLGFLWVLVDRRRQGWHDKLTDTHVVYAWDAKMSKRNKRSE